MTELWVDISNYQGLPDFNAMRGHVTGAIIKASEGTGFVNPNLKYQAEGAAAAGLKRKFYHFADYTDMAAEARHFLAAVAPYIKSNEDSVLDGEYNVVGNVGGPTLTWLQIVQSARHLAPWFYSYGPWIRAHLGGDARLKPYPLWIAAYQAQEPAIPAPWSSAVAWQFTDRGTVPGIHGLVDEDDVFIATPLIQEDDDDDLEFG